MNLILLNVINMLAAIDGEAVKQALEIFWKGMVAIVIVIGIIFVIVLIINKISADQHKKKQAAQCGNDSPDDNT